MQKNTSTSLAHKPKIRLSELPKFKAVQSEIKDLHLHTICESGNCPNKKECWSRGTATFMILGNICTRSCRFCGVATGKPMLPDAEEPSRIAESIQRMQLKHCVITSVDRDDLADGGAQFWADTISCIKHKNPELTLETLIPDFQGNTDCLDVIVEAKPEIISHNIETVRRMTKHVRVQARYDQSLQVLSYLHSKGVRTKTGIMVGVGETNAEVLECLQDIFDVGCRIVTIGQYFQPSKSHLPVERFVEVADFARFKTVATGLGFDHVESAPLVRSSYFAEKHVY